MSIRGFSSDHSTDIALWIDGVPINEPVNGHAEGYNDFSTIFPEAVSGIDVIKGPTSAVFGNFAFSGVINVRTLDRIDNTQLDDRRGQLRQLRGRAAHRLRPWQYDGHARDPRDARRRLAPAWQNQIGQLHGRLEHELSHNTTLDLGLELYATTYNSPGFLDTASYLERRYNVVSNFGDGGFKRRRPGAREPADALHAESGVAHDALWDRRHLEFLAQHPAGTGRSARGKRCRNARVRWALRRRRDVGATYTSSRVNITIGGEARYDYSDYENWGQYGSKFRTDSVPFGLTQAHQTSGGLFVQSSYYLTRFLRVDFGGRVDQLSSYAHTPSTYNYGSLPDGALLLVGTLRQPAAQQRRLLAEDRSAGTSEPVGERLRQRLAGMAPGRRRHLRSDRPVHHSSGTTRPASNSGEDAGRSMPRSSAWT